MILLVYIPDPRAKSQWSSNRYGSHRTSDFRSSWQPYDSEHANIDPVGFETRGEGHIGHPLELSSDPYIMRVHCDTSQRSTSR